MVRLPDDSVTSRAPMRRFLLRFDHPLEEEFADEYFERTLPQVRAAVLLGCFLYVVFAALDFYVAPRQALQLGLVRLVVVVFVIACFAFSYAPAFRRFHEWALSIALVIAGAGLVTMIAMLEPPGNFVYYAGLLLVLMFAPLIRLSIRYAVVSSTLVIVMFLGGALWINRTPIPFVAYNVSYLAATMVVSFLASYSIERYARSNFLQRRVIERRTNELEEKNAELTAKNQMLAQSRAQTMRTAQRSELIFSALSEALPGTVLDEKYRIGEKIGSGNFGTVYRGEHILLHHPVAIKVFRPAVGNAGLESLERFRLEGISACRVNHPNAVSVLDFDVSAGSLAYLVMELLEGHSLAEELTLVGRVPSSRCARIAASVCDVLVEAHGAGILHRDIKPSNVFLHRGKGEERVKVIDFGIAKLTGESMDVNVNARATATGIVVGSPAYMAPERFRGDPYAGRADVYAVGGLVY